MRLHRVMISALVLLTGACGDSTGPAQLPSLTGSWSLTHAGITAGGDTCSIAGTTMVLSQSGGQFSGTYSGGVLLCDNAAGVLVGTGTIVNGTLNGSAIAFNLDDPSWHNVGTLTAHGMTGTTTLVINTSQGSFQATGEFEASKR
jgi:hypothetical protein